MLIHGSLLASGLSQVPVRAGPKSEQKRMRGLKTPRTTFRSLQATTLLKQRKMLAARDLITRDSRQIYIPNRARLS